MRRQFLHIKYAQASRLKNTGDGVQRKIREMLSQLPERQIEVITLRYFEDFSVEEIADIMGINEKSVRNLIYKAITSFRQTPQNFIISLLIFCVLVIL